MRKGRWITGISILALAGMLFLTSCQKVEGPSDVEKDPAGTQSAKPQSEEAVFGTFVSQTVDGTEVTQDIFAEADLTMVNIWGTFCGPCIAEMPELGELSREYEGSGVRIIGMLCDVYEPGDEEALEIIEATEADYMHIVASDDLMKGNLGAVQAVPTTVFVDKEGKQVGKAYSGATDKETWKQRIEELREEVQ